MLDEKFFSTGTVVTSVGLRVAWIPLGQRTGPAVLDWVIRKASHRPGLTAQKPAG